jgi:5-methylcytosine-specific restriction endonuclease McrA
MALTRQQRWQERNAEHYRAQQRAAQATPEHKAKKLATQRKNRDAYNERNRRYAASPKGLAAKAEKEARRRARIKSQTCDCCTPADIRPIYLEAQEKGLEVDHIIALANNGPHCLKNLQLLTKAENIRKGAN